jgi:hypothetical protein
MPAPIRGPFRIQAAAALVCALFSACGGGGGGGGASVSPTTKVGSSATAGPSAAATLSVSFQQYTPVQTSSTKRAPKFVSPATQAITLSLLSVNGATPANAVPTTVNVGPSATGCTTVGAKVTCSVNFSAPVGTDVFQATSLSSTGTTLGTASLAATITANAQNAVALDIGGNIAQLQMYLAQSTFTQGASAQALVVIVPLDASGAVIVNPGNYNPSISVTSSDTSGNFSLILDGTNSGTSATVASPSDQLVLNYSGTGHAHTNITASAGTGTGAPTFTVSADAGSPSLGSTVGGAYQSSTPNHFAFTSIGQTGTLTVSGGTPPYTVTSSDTATATISGSSPNYTVTATGYGASGLGTATITVTDSASPTANVSTQTVTVVPAAITATLGTCGSSATCTTTGVSFPTTNSGTNLASTYTLGGGILSYTYQWVSSATTTSQYGSASISGNALTITPNGAGSDVLLITSGSQTYLIGVNDVAPGAATYSISGAVHAYSPSANNLTMSYNSTAGNNASATLTLSTGNAPWTVTSSNTSVVTVAASQGGYVLTPVASSGTATITLTPAVGTAPTPLAVTVIPMLSVSPTSIALHATGDTFSVTVSNGTSGGLTIGSGSISESSGGTVIGLTSYSSGTLSGGAVASPADTTGASTITFHDTNVDRKVTTTVSLDDALDLAIRASINNLNINGTQQSRIGLLSGRQSTFSMPSTVTAASLSSGAISTFTFTAGSPGSLALLPTVANNGVVLFEDAAGGSVTYPYTTFGLTFAYPGTTLPTPVNESFTSTSQSDVISVTGTSGSISASSSNPSVVTASATGTTLTLQPVGAGYATITIADTGNSAATTFSVAVTTATIPISSRNRR